MPREIDSDSPDVLEEMEPESEKAGPSGRSFGDGFCGQGRSASNAALRREPGANTWAESC